MIPSYMKDVARVGLLVLAVISTAGAATNRYLFVGHPRAAGPGQIVQREVERIDFSRYDALLLGGDYTISRTASRDIVDYLDALFALSAPTTLASLGNHDTSHRNYFTYVSGRPTYYAARTNGITFVVLDTTGDLSKLYHLWGERLRLRMDRSS